MNYTRDRNYQRNRAGTSPWKLLSWVARPMEVLSEGYKRSRYFFYEIWRPARAVSSIDDATEAEEALEVAKWEALTKDIA